MLKKILLAILLLIVPLTLRGQEPEIPVLQSVSEGVGKLVIINIPFHHVGLVPDLGAAKVNLLDDGATLGLDYVLTGVGIAHNIKTGDGIAVLEFIILDDTQGEPSELFTIILDLGDRTYGGSIRIVDNDTI